MSVISVVKPCCKFATKATAEETIFRTPRRQRRLTQREGNVGRRRSLFSESRESDDDVAALSPTSSEVGTPNDSPVVAVKNLESNFNQLLLNRTPSKQSPVCSPVRFSPRIRGIKCLSEDTDVIKRNTFYGGQSLNVGVGSLDGKSLLASVRSAVPLKARTRLFSDDDPKERKKRARTASFLDSAKRPKKKPRLQENLPCINKALIVQKLNKLKARLAQERAAKKKKKLRSKEYPEEMTVYSEGKSTSKKEIQQPHQKRRYNWEIFSCGNDVRYSRSLDSSVTMTPPTTNKKKKLMSTTVDFLATPPPKRRSDSSEDETTDHLIEEIKNDVKEMMVDEDKEVQVEVDNLLLQLENRDLDDASDPSNQNIDPNGKGIPSNQNIDPNGIPSTPSSSSVLSEVSTPSQPKLFPVFTKTPSSGSSTSSSLFPTKATPKSTPSLRGMGMNQMLLDCGQSNLREVECPVCELVYVQGVPEDEVQHLKYHSTMTQMKYHGFKNEKVAGVKGLDKVIVVRQRGEDPRVWKKALDYKRVVDAELGAPARGDVLPEQVYLYIKNKQVVGLLCAVVISEAHRLLHLSNDVSGDPNLPSLCSEERYPAKCGITRLWVSPSARKSGVATAMVDALRRNFLFGSILALDDVAMSSPTADGRIFGFKYFDRKDFLVY